MGFFLNLFLNLFFPFADGRYSRSHSIRFRPWLCTPRGTGRQGDGQAGNGVWAG